MTIYTQSNYKEIPFQDISVLQPNPFQGIQSKVSKIVQQNDQSLINGTVWGAIGSVLAFTAIEKGYEILTFSISSEAVRFTAHLAGISFANEIIKTAFIGGSALICFKNADSYLGKSSKIKGAFWSLAGLNFAYDAIKAGNATIQLKDPLTAYIIGIDPTTALIGTILVGGVALKCFSNAAHHFNTSK